MFRTSETDPAYNSVLAISLGGFGFGDRQNRLSPKLKLPKKFSDSSTGLGRATGRRHRPLPRGKASLVARFVFARTPISYWYELRSRNCATFALALGAVQLVSNVTRLL